MNETASRFFHDLVRNAAQRQGIEVSEAAEWYVIQLLERFMRTERGFLDRPLALDFLEAFHDDAAGRYVKWKHVGDTTLFLSGLFMESLERTLVGVDYYTSLGGLAYRHLATTSGTGRGLHSLFGELSTRFPDFVRVLSEIRLNEMFASDRDILRIYRRWLATRGHRDEEILVRRGVIPYAPGGHSVH